jgi:hypothetical protein
MMPDPLPTLLVLFVLSCSITMGVGSPVTASFAAEQLNNRETMDVTLRGGILTLDLRDAPLSDVLQAISEVAGLELTLKGDLSTPTTGSFSLALVEAIKRLVGRKSLLMQFAPTDGPGDSRLTRVFVYGTGGGVRRVGRVEHAALSDAAAVSPEEAYLEEVCADETRTEECRQAYQDYGMVEDEVPGEADLPAADTSDVSPEEAYLEEVCADETRTEECRKAYQEYGVKSEDPE